MLVNGFYFNVQFRRGIVLLTQAPEERQRLVKLVQEEPLPADAPPLPEEDQSDNTAGENDGGEE